MKTRSCTYRIDRRAGYQGPRPSASNQAEVEKLITGRNSSNERPGENQNREINLESPSLNQSTTKSKNKTRIKWTREEYKQVLTAFYTAMDKPEENITEQTFNIWREMVGKNTREYLNPNKLANVRRDILKNNRLTLMEIDNIKADIKTNNEIDHNLNATDDTDNRDPTQNNDILSVINKEGQNELNVRQKERNTTTQATSTIDNKEEEIA